MKVGETLQLSASDLVSHLNCQHLTDLNVDVTNGALKPPHFRDPFLELLMERGEIHERNYVEHLRTAGHEVVQIEGVGVTPALVEHSLTAHGADRWISFVACKTLVLAGDPQQLEQPMKGSHPDGTDVSALDHILGGKPTIGDDQGLFLDETWRLHPDICAFTSESFYENRLRPHAGAEQQTIRSTSRINGTGLRYLLVAHEGNQGSAPEEAVQVRDLVTEILKSNASWIDRKGVECPWSPNSTAFGKGPCARLPAAISLR